MLREYHIIKHIEIFLVSWTVKFMLSNTNGRSYFVHKYWHGELFPQGCTQLPSSVRCDCFAGHVLSSNERSCEDIDECVFRNGGCSEICTNTKGSYHCGCPEGFVILHDGTTCLETLTTIPTPATTSSTTPQTTTREPQIFQTVCWIQNGGCQQVR